MKRFHRTCSCCDHYYARWESERWSAIFLCDNCLFTIRSWLATHHLLDNPLAHELIPEDMRRYNDEFYLTGGIPRLRDPTSVLRLARDFQDST